VNAEQALKNADVEVDLPSRKGKAAIGGEESETRTRRFHRGIGGGM